MNEGIGSSIVLAIIVVAIAFMMSYLAYNVNYTKAFRMKNKVVSLYEKCAGRCNSKCKEDIRGYAADIGYEPEAISSCKSLPYVPGVVVDDPKAEVQLKDDSAGNGYCVFMIREEQDSHTEDRFKEEPRYYYRVVTRINIVVPIVNNIFDNLGALYVTGDTKMFYPEENHTVDTYC